MQTEAKLQYYWEEDRRTSDYEILEIFWDPGK